MFSPELAADTPKGWGQIEGAPDKKPVVHVRPDGNRVVLLSSRTARFIATVMRLRPFAGVRIEAENAQRLIDGMLRDYPAGMPDRPAVMKDIEAIRDAVDNTPKNRSVLILARGGGSSPPRGRQDGSLGRLKGVYRHELTHAVQADQSFSPNAYTHLGRDASKLFDGPAKIPAEKARQYLVSKGYQDHPNVIAAEIGSNLAAGTWERFGLSNEEARQLFQEYQEVVSGHYGPQAAASLRKIATPKLRATEAEYGRLAQTQRNAGGDKRADLRQPDEGTRGLPSGRERGSGPGVGSDVPPEKFELDRADGELSGKPHDAEPPMRE